LNAFFVCVLEISGVTGFSHATASNEWIIDCLSFYLTHLKGMQADFFYVKENAMTPEQISLVQESFTRIAPIAEKAADLFYGKLFELNPELKPLFKGDIKQQGAKLMATLNVVVNGLAHLESIVPAVRELGRRHAGYGVEESHYDTVGQALIWTLGQGLGATFTDDVKEAWIIAYAILAETMSSAASEVAA